MINVHVIRPQQDWVHVLTFCFVVVFFSHMPPTSVKILQNWKLQSPQTRFIKRVCLSERSRSCFLSLRRLSPLSNWRVIKQMVVIRKKWRRSFFFFFLIVLFSASQRGKAYSTPWNWCLIILPFLMWDVVTWSYFFPSLSAETRGQQRRTAQAQVMFKTTASAEIARQIQQTPGTCLQKKHRHNA